jgi:hypothetical protein
MDLKRPASRLPLKYQGLFGGAAWEVTKKSLKFKGPVPEFLVARRFVLNDLDISTSPGSR